MDPKNLPDDVRLSDAEELANALTHGTACAAAAWAAGYVMVNSEFVSSAGRLGFAVYAASLVLVLAMSTLSHWIREPRKLHRLRAWDQGTIYLLISGTYTPGILAFANRWQAIGLLCFVWGIALLGFYSKVFAERRINAVTTVTYLLLGWVPALCMFAMVPRVYFVWLLAGGLCYSVGVVFLVNDRRVRFFHAVWHLWVALAAGVHFYAISTMAI